MSQFYSLKVKDIIPSTNDCKLISFELPSELQAAFDYQQGQYLTLKTELEGEEIRRSYSLCSSPADGKWTIGVKQIPDGRFSTFANNSLAVGDEIEVMPPNGNFFVPVDPTANRNYVAFAAGSGITPIFSIIKTHLLREAGATFKLFYINQSLSSIILREELEALKNQFMGRLEIFYFLTQEHRTIPLLNGRLNEEKLATIFKGICQADTIDHYFSCGPQEMVFMIRDFLESKGVAKDKIHFELFNTGTPMKINKTKVEVDTANASAVTIFEGGKSISFPLEYNGRTLLEAGLAMGENLPYACAGGVCCTCKAKLVEGTVDMKVNYALEAADVAKGYILTCQSVPTSKQVVVDFDG